MLCLKNFIFFTCVVGVLLGYEGLYSSLAMEEVNLADGSDKAARPKRVSSASGLATGDADVHDNDQAAVLPSSVVSGDAMATTVPVDHEAMLMRALLLQRHKYRVRDDFFFVPVPVSGNAIGVASSAILDGISLQGEEIQVSITNVSPRTYRIISIKKKSGERWVDLGGAEERNMRGIGVSLFGSFAQQTRYLAWPSITDYTEGAPFFEENSIESTHLFGIPEQHGKTLGDYLGEGFCWIGKHTTTFKGKLKESGIEVLFSAEAELSPTSAKITGIYYIRDPHDHKVSVFFLIQSPFFAEPQFVFANETMLEAEALAGLPNWTNWIPCTDESPSACYAVKYPPTASTYKYMEGWWKDWVSGAPDYIALNYPLFGFLRQFGESLLLYEKEKGPSSQEVVIGFQPPEAGFYEVLSKSPLRREQYIYVGPNRALHATDLFSQVWRKERRTDFWSVTVCKIGSTVLTPLNLTVPSDLSLGFYEIIFNVDAEEGMHLRSMRDGSTVTLQKGAELPYSGLELQKKGDENGPLDQVLEIAQQPYVVQLAIEDHPVLIAPLSEAMGHWTYLRRLALQNCFDDKSDMRPVFKALRGLENLEELDFRNAVSVKTFRAFAYTLVGMRSEKLTRILVNLPKKPSAVTTPVKQNQISKWTVSQVDPFMYMPALRTLEVFNVRRAEQGLTITREHLENMRRAIVGSKGTAFSPLAIILHRSFEVPAEEWQVVDGSETA